LKISPASRSSQTSQIETLVARGDAGARTANFAFFDHAGNGHAWKGPGGTMLPGGPTRPFTWEIAELFKIERGKIRQIEAVLDQAPYGMGSGWSSREDALSSRIQR